MRKTFFYTLAIAFSSLVFYSCSKDDFEGKEEEVESGIVLVKDEFTIDNTVQTITIELESEADNLIVESMDEWITLVNVKSSSKYTYKFQITAHSGSSTRDGVIDFTNPINSEVESVDIEQLGASFPVEDLTLAYNLNVVYFIPNNIDAPDRYERRISDLMLWTRDFYASNMERCGYGYRPFGLRTSDVGRVELIVINGKYGSQSYLPAGGHEAISSEINAYFKANPSVSGSEHTLVITPSYSRDPFSPGGPPFYSVGRIGYALDYELMDIKYIGQRTTEGELLTKWFGGLAHELGHGVNLPHNSQLVGQSLGTTLMGYGNYTLGLDPTFLSDASCAILNNSQIFATEEREFYQENENIDIDNFHIENTSSSITVKGQFSNSSKRVTAVNVYVDDYPYVGINDSYDAESWSTSDIENGQFNINISTSSIREEDDKFRVRTWLLFDDGTYMEESHDFKRSALEDYSFTSEVVMSRKNWTVSVSDVESGNPASYMLDDDINTYWHSQWNGAKPGHPHNITVTMPEPKTIRGLSFVQRQGMHGAINEFTVEVSPDGVNWENLGNYNLLYLTREQFIYFPDSKSVRMFKITTISNHSESDPKIAVLAEIGAFE